MKPRGFVSLLMLLLAVLACSTTQNLLPATATPAPSRLPPSPTLRPRPTLNLNLASPTDAAPPEDTATEPPSDTEAPSDTPEPSQTPRPARSPTPRATATPAASQKPTAKPTRAATAAPNFLDTAVAVKRQVEVFGGQIDIAVGSGTIDCQQTVDSYNYVAARATLKNVPNSLAGAYSLYTQGVSLFLSKAADLYTNCQNFLANPDAGGEVPALQWTVARTAVNDAGQLLRQAIIAAGGTP